MPRDYKNRINSNNARKKKRPIPGYWWLITGLLIGGFAMFLSDLEEAPNKPVTDVKRPVSQQDVRDVKKPIATTAKPIDSTKPRFDFYQILPDMEIVIPEHEIEERRRLEGTGKSKPGTFIIQIGSFKKAQQADTLRARLALLGIESTVQTVNQSGSIWHRVKSGPYTSFRMVDKIQNRLHRNNIDSIAIKLK
ncbi:MULTISPECIES: SPOR domain-containing protein [Cycloclasticus]|uniref:Cell division protein n=1 Tax=Cycloclasticus zancles 78-ME TaxID=1198232 RepID=S5TUZ1_9GAMM|nr:MULTISPECIES: SPOR domain-containing protein [Cycloclasticus]AFT67971.1 Sporulation-like protein [Cycloclasticus sp. P1]AGS38843.1 Cell division protein [Cycloclasticus zancles 78-ME]MDF1829227.1 SPOR domain-containing protein [Cycloclasticus pugetii]PHR50847.1 MAG: sporulation-like protein [Cycloclasticus sp.]SHI66194.1 cell division protein FtsN [Cycloclasticus pugetii]